MFLHPVCPSDQPIEDFVNSLITASLHPLNLLLSGKRTLCYLFLRLWYIVQLNTLDSQSCVQFLTKACTYIITHGTGGHSFVPQSSCLLTM